MRQKRARSQFKYGRGVGRLSLTDAQGITRVVAEATNTWMYTWGAIAAQLFGRGNLTYMPASFYVEFCNGTAAGSVAIPTVTRADGLSYYTGLSGSPTIDYLRIPFLLQPGLDVDPSSTSYLTASQPNRLSFHALATGATGINGKTFSNGAGSVVYGIAVVATPVPADHTQDLVHARMYWPSNQQTAVPTAGSISVDYQLSFL